LWAADRTAHRAVLGLSARPRRVGALTVPFRWAGASGDSQAQVWRVAHRAEAFAAAMAAIRPPPAGVITWVPLSPRREAERGYDQARALAQALSPRVDVPAVRLLRRVRTTSPQALRPGRERRVLLSDSFRPIRDAPSSVLLVDDVLTTGATSAACARALLSAGAVSVVLVTATRALPGPLPLRYARDGFPFGSVVARGGSPEVDASRGRNDPRKATVGR